LSWFAGLWLPEAGLVNGRADAKRELADKTAADALRGMAPDILRDMASST
jgi:hypothetical protein